MEIVERARAAAQLARAGIAWLRRDLDHPPPPSAGPKFRSPSAAVELVRDGDVVAVAGLGGQQRASIVYAALRRRFEQRRQPRRITLVNVGGQGGRGRVPGTLEDLALPGLCTRFISGHFEALPEVLELAASGACQVQCMPLGTMTRVFESLADGRDSWVSGVGVGTFLDPRIGPGSQVTDGPAASLITAEGERLRYHLPPIDVAICNLPAADRAGNIYVRHAATLGESRDLAAAARRNRGKVIVNVGVLVEEGFDEIYLPADAVDAVVLYPDTEQTATVFHRDPWSVFTPNSETSIADGLTRLRTINTLTGAARQRSEVDAYLARVAAQTMLDHLPSGARVSVGIGLPEEVAAALFEGGVLDEMEFVVESGVVGGLPAGGAFFGASLCPREILASADLFALCEEHLDATCLGALEVDGEGNVNVSRRGEGLRGYVGPGGFPDFTACAKLILFVCGWMRGGEIRLEDDRLRLVEPGVPKFVERVQEVTFSGRRALREGRSVLYATPVGLFQLTEQGLELVWAAPGIDVRRDIVGLSKAAIVVPRGRVRRALSPTTKLGRRRRRGTA